MVGGARAPLVRPSGTAPPCRCGSLLALLGSFALDAQDVLITLVTAAGTEPTRNAVTYSDLVEPPAGDDPLDALSVRLAAAYEEPRLLKFHLGDVGSAAGRAAGLADPGARVSTREQVLTVGDRLRVRRGTDAAPSRPDRLSPGHDGAVRRAPTEAEQAELGELAADPPFVLG